MESSAPSLSRRHVLHLVAGSALALPVTFAGVEAASAARGWCVADPILRIGGQLVHVYIGSEIAMLRAATDKIQLRVTVAPGTKAELRDIAADFGKGYRVRFDESASLVNTRTHIPVQIAVYAPARTDSLPVTVDFTPVGSGPLRTASTSGTANTWILLSTG